MILVSKGFLGTVKGHLYQGNKAACVKFEGIKTLLENMENTKTYVVANLISRYPIHARASLRLATVLKTTFHQWVISYTCSQSNSGGSVFLTESSKLAWLQVYDMTH